MTVDAGGGGGGSADAAGWLCYVLWQGTARPHELLVRLQCFCKADKSIVVQNSDYDDILSTSPKTPPTERQVQKDLQRLSIRSEDHELCCATV